MTTPTSFPPENTSESAAIRALIEQLQASCTWKLGGRWQIYVCALLYGFVAHLQGPSFFILYCGALVVIFMLQASNDQRTRQQIDLLVQLARELDKKGRLNDNGLDR